MFGKPSKRHLIIELEESVLEKEKQEIVFSNAIDKCEGQVDDLMTILRFVFDNFVNMPPYSVSEMAAAVRQKKDAVKRDEILDYLKGRS